MSLRIVRCFLEETRNGRYAAYAIALILVMLAWTVPAHRAASLIDDAMEKERRATRALWPMYARMLIDCMNGKGFATQDVAVLCYPTQIVQSEE